MNTKQSARDNICVCICASAGVHVLLTRVRSCHLEVMLYPPETPAARSYDGDVNAKMRIMRLESRGGESQDISPLIAWHKACTSHAYHVLY